MKTIPRRFLSATTATFLTAAVFSAAPPSGEARRVEDVIPLTAGNLRGHKMLFDEGWTIVSSSDKALEFAKRKALVSSREAVRMALRDVSRATDDAGRKLRGDLSDSAAAGRDVVSSATARSVQALEDSNGLARRELAYGEAGFKAAAKDFVLGNISLARRTEEDRRELAALPGGYFQDVKSDFSDVYARAEAARRRFAEKIDPAWEKSFAEAARDFRSEYERSGAESNALLALAQLPQPVADPGRFPA